MPLSRTGEPGVIAPELLKYVYSGNSFLNSPLEPDSSTISTPRITSATIAITPTRRRAQVVLRSSGIALRPVSFHKLPDIGIVAGAQLLLRSGKDQAAFIHYEELSLQKISP